MLPVASCLYVAVFEGRFARGIGESLFFRSQLFLPFHFYSAYLEGFRLGRRKEGGGFYCVEPARGVTWRRDLTIIASFLDMELEARMMQFLRNFVGIAALPLFSFLFLPPSFLTRLLLFYFFL